MVAAGVAFEYGCLISGVALEHGDRVSGGMRREWIVLGDGGESGHLP